MSTLASTQGPLTGIRGLGEVDFEVGVSSKLQKKLSTTVCLGIQTCSVF